MVLRACDDGWSGRVGWGWATNKQPANVNANVNEELSRRGICAEEQGGADLSLSFQCVPQVRGRDGRSIEAEAMRMGSACMCMYGWMCDSWVYRDGWVLILESTRFHSI